MRDKNYVEHRLAWLTDFVSFIGRSTDGGILSTEITGLTDPLKKQVRLRLGRTWVRKNFNPVEIIANAYAKANDCMIEKMSYDGESLVMSISTKRRLGRPMRKSPWDKKGG